MTGRTWRWSHLGNVYKSGLLICAGPRLVGKNLKSRDLRFAICDRIWTSKNWKVQTACLVTLYDSSVLYQAFYVKRLPRRDKKFFLFSFGSPFLDNQPPAFQWWYPKTITILLGQAPAFPMMIIGGLFYHTSNPKCLFFF